MRTIIIVISACTLLAVAASSVAGPRQPPPREGAELGNLIAPYVPRSQNFDFEIAGLPKGTRPEVLTWDRIYALAVIRARGRRGAFLPALDPADLAREAVRQGVTDFARFRTQFHGNGPFRDPGPSVLELERRLLAIDITRRNVAFHENVHKLILERVQGSSSGLSAIDGVKVFALLLRARQKLTDEIAQFRDGLDELKFRLGLSPRAPVILDRRDLEAFPAVFDAVDDWQRGAHRKLDALPGLVAKLPAPGEVVVDGEPILARIEKEPDRLEEVLAGAAQVALRSRSERDEVPTQPNSGVQLELQVRRRIRSLVEKRIAYQAQKQCFEQAILLKDQAFERMAAPPGPVIASRSSQLNDVIEQQAQFIETQNRLIALWTSFRAERLALYHDLGVLPFKDWKAFFADLKCERGATIVAPAVPSKPAAPAASLPPPPALPRP